MKVCCRCRQSKPTSEFHKNSRSLDGLTYQCKSCAAVRSRASHAANPERRKLTSRKCELNTKYRMTLNQYDTMLADQDGRCLICNRVETSLANGGEVRRLTVDHDHACCPGKRSCGKCIRGLLCNRCNHAIGKLEDNPELLESAARYLRNRSHHRRAFSANPKVSRP